MLIKLKPTVIQLFIYLLLLSTANAHVDNQAPLQEPFLLKEEGSPLLNTTSFLIYYMFADKPLADTLKKEMIDHLQKIGVVYSGDDSKLNEHQRKEKYQTGQAILEIVVSPLAEERSTSASDYQKLPLWELSLKVKAGVNVISNGAQIPCTVWEKERFIGSSNDKAEWNKKTIGTLRDLFNSFIADYEKSNPQKQKVQFFLYS